ncbi:MAG: hypothetical protein PHU42_02225 [Patescibacteria group bacterium]|nr:hypothetical protein [Patescibacteria group bacterium]
MAKAKKELKKEVSKGARDFKSIFSEFGEAVGSIVKDSKLRSETQKIGESFAGAGRALVERIRDKEVKKEFKDVRRAAQKFGKDAAKTWKKSQPEIKKAVKNATKTVKKTVRKIEKKVAKKNKKK